MGARSPVGVKMGDGLATMRANTDNYFRSVESSDLHILLASQCLALSHYPMKFMSGYSIEEGTYTYS